MTRQTVSISNIHGGVALDAAQAEVLAIVLETVLADLPDEREEHVLSRQQVARIMNLLRGHAPSGPRRYHLYGGADLDETR